MSIRKVVPIEQAEWCVAPVPAWADMHEPDWAYIPPDGHAVACLLVDDQHHVGTQANFYRTVRKLLNLSAVQALGQAEVDFDPAAYRLRIHELAIWRQGADGLWKPRSLAQKETFMLRQREQQLEQQMLNGRVSVVALLEDVRVGDAIELTWTLEPRDQMAGLRFTEFSAFVWALPVGRVFFTLHLAPEHPIRWKMHASAGVTPPQEEVTSNKMVWRVERPPIFIGEPNVPSGHWPFAILDVTGWTTWGQVAGFVADLWADALADGAEAIAAEAERFRAEAAQPWPVRAAITAAIRFVQEEVRYLAVDIGHGGGLLPNGAGTVLRRRFGDCKDKSVLLVALLRALGVEAWPLLVAANWRGAVQYFQPSTSAFNHAIVTFIAEGRRHFIDPTFLGQGGDLNRLVAPAYGYGLEIRQGAQDLLPLPELPAAEIILTEVFDLDRKQKAGAVDQTLGATGWLADDVRGALIRQGRGSFFKKRAEALQRHFPALVPDENTVSVNDDPAANTITLRSRYALPTWGAVGEKPPAMFRYGGHGLFLAVEQVDGPEKRQQPWALRYPLTVRHRVVVRGRCVRQIKDSAFQMVGPGFRYTCEMKSASRVVTFEYRWETTAPEVPAEKWAEYCRRREAAFSQAGANVATGYDFRSLKKPLIFCGVSIGLLLGAIWSGPVISPAPQPAAGEPASQAAAPVLDDAALQYRHVQVLLRSGKATEAREMARQMLENFPQHPLSWAALAVSSWVLKDPATAEPAFVQWVRRAPRSAEARSSFGVFLTQNGRAGEARTLLAKATEEFPENGLVWLGYAAALDALGEKKAAREAAAKGQSLLALAKKDQPKR